MGSNCKWPRLSIHKDTFIRAIYQTDFEPQAIAISMHKYSFPISEILLFFGNNFPLFKHITFITTSATHYPTIKTLPTLHRIVMQ